MIQCIGMKVKILNKGWKDGTCGDNTEKREGEARSPNNYHRFSCAKKAI